MACLAAKRLPCRRKMSRGCPLSYRYDPATRHLRYALYLLIGNAQFLGGNERQRGPGAADIDSSHGDCNRSVSGNIEIGAGLPAKVKPETTGHAPALVFLQFGAHMGVFFTASSVGPMPMGP